MKVLQILVLMCGLVVSLNAQKSILSGTIYDASGAVIPKIKVTAVNENGKNFETETNNEGIYELSLVYNTLDSANSKIAKYEIIVDIENRGFEKFVLKDFKFAPSYKGKMNIDIALDSINPEPCGYSGADCPAVLYCGGGEQEIIQTTGAKISDKIRQRPLEKLPEEKNKTKRKIKIINNE